MPREEGSIFTWGMPSYQDAKQNFLGTTPALKVTNTDNEVVKKTEPPKPKSKPRKKMGVEVKNYIVSLLTKEDS